MAIATYIAIAIAVVMAIDCYGIAISIDMAIFLSTMAMLLRFLKLNDLGCWVLRNIYDDIFDNVQYIWKIYKPWLLFLYDDIIATAQGKRE